MQEITRRMQWIAAFGLFVGGLLLATGFAHAEPALWVVKGPHAKVYLFGSVHLLKKDAPWRTPKIDAAITEWNAVAGDSGRRRHEGGVAHDHEAWTRPATSTLHQADEGATGEAR